MKIPEYFWLFNSYVEIDIVEIDIEKYCFINLLCSFTKGGLQIYNILHLFTLDKLSQLEKNGNK